LIGRGATLRYGLPPSCATPPSMSPGRAVGRSPVTTPTSAIAHDGGKPYLSVAPRPIKLAGALPYFQKGILKHVGGSGAISKDGHCNPKQACGLPDIDRPQSSTVALGDRNQQVRQLNLCLHYDFVPVADAPARPRRVGRLPCHAGIATLPARGAIPPCVNCGPARTRLRSGVSTVRHRHLRRA
jgi:hypothetical protein